MSTTMHRLQISLPHWEMEFLKARARRDGQSIAEVIRQIVKREAEASLNQATAQSIWAIAGIGADRGTLIGQVPVSERPELFLAELSQPPSRPRQPRRPGSRPRKTKARR